MTQPNDLHATQAFFALRAAGWEERFPNDVPLYARAVAELQLRAGSVALDLGCGTGRALVPLREAVGVNGRVIGLDVTEAMLTQVQRFGRGQWADLILGDVLRLPFPMGYADVIFAGGLLPHLREPVTALLEFARVVRPGGQLAVFHPLGRVALAARHSHVPTDDDVLSPKRLPGLCRQTGWHVVSIDNAEDRYLALAVRQQLRFSLEPMPQTEHGLQSYLALANWSSAGSFLRPGRWPHHLILQTQ